MSAGSLILIMPKYVSVSSQPVSQFVGQVATQPVRRQSTSKFPFTFNPAYTHTHTLAHIESRTPFWVHTIFKLGKPPTPTLNSRFQPHSPCLLLTRKQNSLAAAATFGAAHVPKCVAEFSNLFFSKWFKALHVLGATFQVRVCRRQTNC